MVYVENPKESAKKKNHPKLLKATSEFSKAAAST